MSEQPPVTKPKMCEACVEHEHMWNNNPTHSSEGCTTEGCECPWTRCEVRDKMQNRCCLMQEDHPAVVDRKGQVRLSHRTPVSWWSDRG